ncbi:hypothetical protein DUNSADRAFT_3114 [Dunaliella salina]|uniref:Encoded protein n=1 Tax=Dunaliella salina TaxID=3046 RepID=A0ABQ7H806_DUNSA|nr:hypothetical protein DUNSADRAFT_3114 [Dunaliella salina]|eukprot:KAF5842985.1 hypothetical protein DUNSADRAFT_3114 [Dunaliella salina]
MLSGLETLAPALPLHVPLNNHSTEEKSFVEFILKPHRWSFYAILALFSLHSGEALGWGCKGKGARFSKMHNEHTQEKARTHTEASPEKLTHLCPTQVPLPSLNGVIA